MNIDYTQPQLKDNIRQQLTEGVVKLSFRRSDGTMREMAATLNSAMLPPQNPDSHPGPPNEHLQVVWDTQANGWRSFRWERLTGVETDVDAEQMVDMAGENCIKCHEGTYDETTLFDDMDGVQHCRNCNHEIKRHLRNREIKALRSQAK